MVYNITTLITRAQHDLSLNQAPNQPTSILVFYQRRILHGGLHVWRRDALRINLARGLASGEAIREQTPSSRCRRPVRPNPIYRDTENTSPPICQQIVYREHLRLDWAGIRIKMWPAWAHQWLIANHPACTQPADIVQTASQNVVPNGSWRIQVDRLS